MTRADADRLYDLIDLALLAAAAHTRAVRDYAGDGVMVAQYARTQEAARTALIAFVEHRVEAIR